ncbi:MAG: PilZ domain-containing protein [Syntrophotaleaceae bacterium]
MSALDHLKDFRIIQITLPIRDDQTMSLECVARRRSVDTVEATFLTGQLPVEELDLKGGCRLFFEEDGHPIRLRATIEEVLDGDKLRLKVVETPLQFGNREFFRVDTDLTIRYTRFVEGEENQPRQIKARVNISGCGIRMPLPDTVQLNEKISLTLIFSEDPPKQATCIGQVKRLCPFAGGRKGVAMHFIEIESADRDAIIGFCMAAQREELRNKIQTRDLG